MSTGKRGAWAYLRGAMGSFTQALKKVAQGLGVDIRPGTEVHHICVEGGRATGALLHRRGRSSPSCPSPCPSSPGDRGYPRILLFVHPGSHRGDVRVSQVPDVGVRKHRCEQPVVQTPLRSLEDVERLRRIRDLLAEGLNLAGIARVLELEAEVARLRAECERLKAR